MVLGGPEETGQLLKHKFDYIFFTGKDGPGQDPGDGGSREYSVKALKHKAIGQGREPIKRWRCP